VEREHPMLPVATEPSPGANVEPFKVLVVDDDQDAREAVEMAVRSFGHSCRISRDGLEAWEMHSADRADIIISDWKMPRMDGLELCRRVRSDDPSRTYTHFIFVTANADKAQAAEAMRAGADDYLRKPMDIDDLETRLAVARRVLMLQRELRAHNRVLRSDSERALVQARTDPLTAASNRLALAEDLEVLAARAARYRHRYCAALCDVDQFKAYNDHFGHLPGDDVLRNVARAIHEALRGGDDFYRYGGEEFLAILPEQSLTEAAAGMDRVRKAVQDLQIPHAPQASLPFVTISVGIAELGPESASSMDEWLRRSDKALYAAKAHGRNRVEIEALEERADHHMHHSY
jgi:diguanylate cyclase (GGDEF)-like protein